MTPPVILTIAGSDSSGGAGIQADIKTISALGGYAASAITAVTAQNTLGVHSVYPLPTEIVQYQIEAVLEDLRPSAVKIGMVYNASIVQAIVRSLQKTPVASIVFDPVMISTSGRRLMTEDTLHAIESELFPICTLITPNLDEARLLYHSPLATADERKDAARALAMRYRTSVLIKGGHLTGDQMDDLLCQWPLSSNSIHQFNHLKIDSSNLHGTGCTLSSAIATFLAQGHSLETSVRLAKNYVSAAIDHSKEFHIGQGNGPLWHFFPNKLCEE